MTESISNNGRRPQLEAIQREAMEKTGRKSSSDSSAAPAATRPAPANDLLQLSNVSQAVMAGPDMDRAKIDAIKQAIRDGQYPLNPRKIAESFAALEQMIR